MKRCVTVLTCVCFLVVTAAGVAASPPVDGTLLDPGPGGELQRTERRTVGSNLPGPEIRLADARWMNPHRLPTVEPIGTPPEVPPLHYQEPPTVSRAVVVSVVAVAVIVMALTWEPHLDIGIDPEL